MSEIGEFRVVLTVEDFDEAAAFYRDVIGLRQVADWSSDSGRVILLEAGPATLEVMDQAQAEMVDQIEVGQRVSGTVRLGLEVADSEETSLRLIGAGAREVAQPVMTPWGDCNTRVETPDGMQLTLFSPR